MSEIVLAVREYGTSHDDGVIVALHGSNCTKEAWERIATEGLCGRRWICPDLRGHGDSPGRAPWTVPQFAKDVVATLGALGEAGPLDVIGQSLGGVVAAELTRQIPSRVRSVVLIDPVLGTREECLALVERLRETRVGPDFDTPDGLIDPLLERVPVSARDHLRRELITRLEPTGTGRYRFRAREHDVDAIHGDMCDQMPYSFADFDGRVLLLEARQSEAVTKAGREHLRSELGDRMTHVTINTGHDLLWYAYDETLDEISRFLKYEH